MGLRLDRRQRGALRQLWRVGDAGIAVIASKNMGLLLRHGLAEMFVDPKRIGFVSDRYRLTLEGRQLCRQLFGPQGLYPTQPRRSDEEDATRSVADRRHDQ